MTDDPGTVHTLLGGRVRLRQPAGGLRAGLDAVMLAASARPRPGDRVLDAGCGAGAVFLCLLARCADLHVVAVERDPGLAALARENAALNGWEDRVTVVEGDVSDPALRARLPRCRHALCNPPYWPGGTAPPAALRAAATHAEDAPLLTWSAFLASALHPGGHAALVLPAARLDEAITTLRISAFGAITILPLWPRIGVPAKRVILCARRGARGPARLLPGLVLHGETGWTVEADAVLRGAGALLPDAGN
ncbi:tRNA1(Val) (adenine(37)-N6)-methyltransferase [Muricoccus radiodurans]|uniref:tRNA1(Val) (adenine(37)-N6)-methyltransferase n=1 Tax=Muricoccus radiodurans TaxID=2231721 RepID=UPI003CF3A6CE